MRAFLVALVVLLLAAVGGDRVAHELATDEAEQRLVAEGFADPQVEVSGFPFVTQLLSRSFDEVRLEARSVRREGRVARDVAATGFAVDVPRGGDVSVGRLTAEGTVSYSEVLDAVGVPGLSLEAAGDGEVGLGREVEVLGQTLSVAATGRVEARGDTLRIVPTGFELAGGGAVDGRIRPLLVERFSIDYRLRDLPDGLSVEDVTATPEGFSVGLVGEDVTFAG